MKAKNVPTIEEDKAEGVVRNNIVKLFLDIFKIQKEVPRDTPAGFSLLNRRSDDIEHVYELRVRRNKKWETRRMSVSRIGESSGTRTRSSKSVCFKVIFDDLLVIKIPPVPIKSYKEYIQSLSLEGRIAVKLDPKIEFVAPGVAALLKRIHQFDNADEYPPGMLEKRYLFWLKKNPRFRQYLKIGGVFVFFMDLSKYSFLSNVVETLHDPAIIQKRMQKDILNSHDFIWDVLGFEGKYGSNHLSVCFSLNKIFSEFETDISRLTKHYESLPAISTYQRQDWFLTHLAGKYLDKKDISMKPDFIDSVNNMLCGIFEKNIKVVNSHREAVIEYIRETTFSRNKPLMSGLIANLLDLMAWLKEREVSIRDLKPDNLFVVGDSETNPLFLASVNDSSLGLIDFETAVDCKLSLKKTELSQPMLAGTPTYSTPSHLFPNDLLKTFFPDLPHLFYLQDWQASIGMIYNVVTGECLFEKTRKTLPKIKKLAQEAFLKKKPLSDVFIRGSRLFWSYAAAELTEKLKQNRKNLKSVEVYIPENARKMFLHAMSVQIKKTANTLKKYVISQVIFNSSKNRKNLIQCPVENIRKYRKKWEEGKNKAKTPADVQRQIVKFLKNLEWLKVRIEEEQSVLARLRETDLSMTAYDLLQLIFQIVFKAMYKEKWGRLPEVNEKILPDGFEDDEDGEATILFEATIAYETTER